MKRVLKKGFTIVELAIVIAVIAILVAVIIPTVTTIVGNAKISSDTVMVKNLNTALAIEEAKNDKNATMTDALSDVSAYGYDVTKISPTSAGNDIIWDSVNDRFALVKSDGSEVIYSDPSYSTNKPKDMQCWTVAAAYTAGKYSVYLTASEQNEIEVSTGIDVSGVSNVTKVTYKTEAAQSVVIRTQSDACELVIDAAQSDVDFYGFAKAIDVASVKSESLHIYGSVNDLSVTAGHVKVEASGVVFNVSSNGGTITNNGYIAKAEGITVGGKEVGGDYVIDSLSALKTFRNTVNAGNTFKGLTAKLTADIALEDGWTPIGEGSRKAAYGQDASSDTWVHAGTAFEGTFNGNGKTISNLNDKGFVPTDSRLGTDKDTKTYAYGLFALTGSDAHIFDLTLTGVDIDTSRYESEHEGTNGDSVAALVGFSAGNLTVENVTVEGSIKAADAVGGVVGRAYAQETNKENIGIVIKNCVNKANVSSTGKVAGILGYVQPGVNVTIEGCKNAGTIKAEGTKGYVAGIFCFGGGTAESSYNYSVKNNVNEGNLYCSEEKKHVATIGQNCSNPVGNCTAVITGNTNMGKVYCGEQDITEDEEFVAKFVNKKQSNYNSGEEWQS